MDGLSAAASAFAVIGLAGQILSGIRCIADFWGSMRDAPTDIEDVIHELRLLAAILERIQNTANLREIDPLLIEALESCKGKVDRFVAFTTEVHPSYQSSRRRIKTWKTFKAAFQGERLSKFRVSLVETKLTLSLIRQDLAERLHYTFQDQVLGIIAEGFTTLKSSMESRTVTTTTENSLGASQHVTELRNGIHQITRTMSNSVFRAGYETGVDETVRKLADFIKTQDRAEALGRVGNTTRDDTRVNLDIGPLDLERGTKDAPEPNKTVEDSRMLITRSFLGVFQLQYRKLRLAQPYGKDTLVHEYQTSFRYHPAPWLLHWNVTNSGLSMHIANSTQGWKNTLRTFRAVLNNAPIFDFCRTGNFDAARTLLASGQASPLDTNDMGWTPLHFASYGCHVELSRLLIVAGADQNSLTYDFPLGNYEICAPIVAASTLQRGHEVSPQRRIDTLRLLMKGTELDFSQSDSQAWKLILVILERSRPSSGYTNENQVANWIFDLFQEEIRHYCPAENLFWILLFCLEDEELCSRLLDMRPEAMNAVQAPDGFTVIHCKIAEDFPSTVMGCFRILARRGADLHRIGTTMDYGAEVVGSIADTPTSMALRRSVSFDRWRRTVQDSGLDLRTFIDTEIEVGLLQDQGWTNDTLLSIFELDYQPREMPAIECSVCSRHVRRLYALEEQWWELLKSSVRRPSENDNGDESDGDMFYSYTPSDIGS